MNKTEEIEFLKNYYNLLKLKDMNMIGDRFSNQIKQLVRDGEISSENYNIISSCLTIGKTINKEITAEELELLKELINIGAEIKDEENGRKVARKLVDCGNVSDSCSYSSSSGYSGSSRGGC